MNTRKARLGAPHFAALMHGVQHFRHGLRTKGQMAMAFIKRHPLLHTCVRIPKMFWNAGVKFFAIDGDERAAAFAYYAFFALFPLILLFVTLGSQVWDHDTVVSYIIDNLGYYMPFNPSDRNAVDAIIHGIVDSRNGVSTLAMLGLVWSSTRFFHTMVRGVNCAWDTIEYPWWQLPMHSLMMLGLVASALFIGVLVPLALGYLRHITLLQNEALIGHFELIVVLLPSLVLFYGLSMFFKFSPRRRTRLTEVMLPALITTVLLQVCRNLFERYVYELSNFNAVYGAFAMVIIFLVWIYLSGSIIVYGGCLCAAQVQVFGRPKRLLLRRSRRGEPVEKLRYSRS